ncbi:MAG: hypothetical protein ACLFN8_01720 [Candidatus Woesearchaeota archaeon]
MQSRSVKQIIQRSYSPINMEIKTEVPAIDYVWVEQTIKEFLEEQRLLSSLKNISIYFTYQPVRRKIIKCVANVKMKSKSNTLTVTGHGIDEYQAVYDLLEKLEFKVLLDSNLQKSISGFFFSNSMNQFQRGDQCA